ncbi:MAG: hypothetical protein U1F76_32080 [Candidatus Competibacteraceae bacterium]
MKTKSITAVSRTPAWLRSVHPVVSTATAGRLLGVALCYALLLFIGLAPGVAAAGGLKVTLCHVPPGDPNNPQTLTVAPNAVQAHLKNHPNDHLGACCQADSQCNDADPCTTDTCTNAGACVHAPVTCTSGDACNDDVCIPSEGGCVAVPKPQGTVCDDENACTGTDVCDGAGQCGGAAIAGCCLNDAACNDNNACSTDVCNLTTHTCSNTQTPPAAVACHVYVCDPEVGWIDTDVTCSVDVGDICHIAVCDPSIGTEGTCVTQPNPTNSCQNGGTCGSGPTCNCPAGYTGTHCETFAQSSCSDGVDNDSDGLVDSADPACAVPCAADPCNPNPCGLYGRCNAIPEGYEEYRDTYGCYYCMYM